MKFLLNENVCIVITLHTVCYISGLLSMEIGTKLPLNVQDALKTANDSVQDILNNSRRIMMGEEVHSSRPYMVYLKMASNNPKYKDYHNWLCGGVIVHEEYILTSAACIEDAKHFYVVSGTYKYNARDDRFNNPCIKNGAKKAVWKCIPRNYIFDGHENDNIRWMNNDIAVVKVEDEFDFSRRVRGCDFVPKPICYNNASAKLEAPGGVGYVAGWGSTEKYNEGQSATDQNLLDAEVYIITKNHCKKRWGRRYHNIIDNYMICSKDMVPELSEVCSEKYVDCTDIMYSDESEDTRRVLTPSSLVLHSAFHNQSSRRDAGKGSGGFCENDHGGPLIVGKGVDSVVIGIISACLVKEKTNRCYGPFLYTSVYKNRNLINCAIYKETAQDCNRLFRSGQTHTEIDISWAQHPDGPAKNELNHSRRNENSTIQDYERPEEILDKQNDTGS